MEGHVSQAAMQGNEAKLRGQEIGEYCLARRATDELPGLPAKLAIDS